MAAKEVCMAATEELEDLKPAIESATQDYMYKLPLSKKKLKPVGNTCVSIHVYACIICACMHTCTYYMHVYNVYTMQA